METVAREFKGIWIPAEIWLSKELTLMEKVLLAEIDSLCGPERNCIASNQYFAKFFEITETRVSDCISNLKKFGYIEQVSFNGRTRELRSCLELKFYSDPKESSTQTRPELLTYNKVNNKDNNTINKQSEPSSEIPSKLFSIAKDKGAKQKQWIEDKAKLVLALGFSKPVQDEIADFLENLVDMDAMLPTRSMRSQLVKLQTLPTPASQITAIQKTVNRGWRSLEYAVDEQLKQNKGRFDTAEGSNNQLRSEEDRQRRSQTNNESF